MLASIPALASFLLQPHCSWRSWALQTDQKPPQHVTSRPCVLRVLAIGPPLANTEHCSVSGIA